MSKMPRQSSDRKSRAREPGVDDIDPAMFEQMAWQAHRELRQNKADIDATSRGTTSAKAKDWRMGRSPSTDRRR